MTLENNRAPLLPGGVLPIWWVIHMCRGFDLLFWPSGYQTRSFFSSINTKTIFWVQILAKFDLFGPKIPFFPWSFWVQFSVARGTPPAILGPSTPPPPGLFYTTSSFVHHFKSISEFKLELQSGNAQIGSKWTIFLSCVTLKFDWWPCKTIGHLFYATSSFVYHFILIGEFKFELQSGNALFGSKSTIFLAVWPWNLTDDPQKQ